MIRFVLTLMLLAWCRFMLQKLFALVDGTAAPDNADALQHQEVLLPGHLLTTVVKVLCIFQCTTFSNLVPF